MVKIVLSLIEALLIPKFIFKIKTNTSKICYALVTLWHPLTCQMLFSIPSKCKKYYFNFLSFGLILSLRIFTKIMNPIILHLRSKNIKVSTYLNDNFTRAQSEGTLKKLCLYCNKSSQWLRFLYKLWKVIHWTFNPSNTSISLPYDKIIKSENLLICSIIYVFSVKQFFFRVGIKSLLCFQIFSITLQANWIMLYW